MAQDWQQWRALVDMISFVHDISGTTNLGQLPIKQEQKASKPQAAHKVLFITVILMFSKGEKTSSIN